MTNHYAVLGIPQDATSDHIKKAYRTLNRKTHPDTAGPGHEAEFDRVQKAYAVLGSEDSRARYDKELQGRLRPAAAGFERESGEPAPESAPEPAATAGGPGDEAFYVPYRGARRNPPLYMSRLPWMTEQYGSVVFTRMPPQWVVAAGCLAVSVAIASVMWLLVSPLQALGVALASAIVFARKLRSGLRPRTWVLGSLFSSLGIASPWALGTMGLGLTIASCLMLAVCAFALGVMLWYRQPRRLGRGFLKNANVFGEPANNLGQSTFRASNTALGADGERLTAALMEQLSCMPGVRIFHSLRFPGSKVADIDHIVTAGNRVLVVDSKAWSATRVDFDAGTGEFVVHLLSGEREFRQSNMSDASAGILRSLRRVCPTVEVRTLTVVHPTSAQEAPAVVNMTEGAPDMAVSGDDFLDVAGRWLHDGSPHVVNVGIVSDLYSRVVA